MDNLDKFHILFTTEDGVNYYSLSDRCWRVFTEPTFFQQWYPIEMTIPLYKAKDEKYFSTEQLATEYVLLNKPCLSKKEVSEWLRFNTAHNVINFDPLNELVKSKINENK